MKPAKSHIPRSLQEVLVLLSWMLLKSPKFLDKSGRFPFQNLDSVFRKLNEGLGNVRGAVGEERYQELLSMSDRMRTLFEADQEDKTGETAQGCKIILEMEDIVRQVQRKP